MESVSGTVAVAAAPPRPPLPQPPFRERITRLLSQWTALQMAVENEWGGPDSVKKSDQLASDIHFWLFDSKELIKVEELENLLHERLLLTFNTEIEDGSIEEVAQELMIIWDEYFQGNVFCVQSSNPPYNTHRNPRQTGQQHRFKPIVLL